MRYALDTNVIIDIFRGDKKLLEKLGIEQGKQYFCITPIVLSELFKGAYSAKRSEEALQLIYNFSQSIDILDFNHKACQIFGQQYSDLKKKGKITQESDLMIASIALAHGAALITRNPKDFREIKGLKVIAW